MTPDQCCVSVSEIREPLVLLDVVEEAGQRHCREKRLSTHSDLSDYFDAPNHQNYSCRLM